jgi:hypothetical protein
MFEQKIYNRWDLNSTREITTMADIKTILRELSVILGFLLAKNNELYTDEFLKVKFFLDYILEYITNREECNSEFKKIEQESDILTHKNIIENGITLGKLIYQKLKLDGNIVWLGAKVHSKYPFDMKIGEIGISLKEDSHILKNPSFSDYLNALVQPTPKLKEVHVFRKFAPTEFNTWFNYTFKKLKEQSENYDQNKIFNYEKSGKIFYIKKGNESLIFGVDNKRIEIGFNYIIDESSLNKRLGGDIFEHTISKWIKQNLEKNDKEYERLKKLCSLKAGENLKIFIESNLNLNSKEILELLQVYDKSYYYGKAHCVPQLYEVPGNKEYIVKLAAIEIKVTESQLNVYFTFEISNINGSNPVKFRVESRYSHGQFKGIPEAKLYYTDDVNHLKNLYKVIN